MSEPETNVPRLVLAAPGTGQGKTTVAAAVMALFAERGLRVGPFKVGPDYLDPTHHRAAAGRPGRNLDAWLLPPDALRALFRRATTGANAGDVAVVEGMMGLFDGKSAADDEGSTAAVAKLLRAPVVLVLDVWTMARTAAAVVHGMTGFDPALPLAGVVLNRAAGRSHFELCRDAIAAATDVPVLGWLPADAALAVPERHLGLVAAGERGMDLARLAERARETLDVDALLRIARAAPPLAAHPDPLPPPVDGVRAVIAIARDAAFDFYYEDNLDLLRAAGAELRFFSPLADARIPADADALYLGGGYPELHAAALAANGEMREAVKQFVASGRPVYAECGGLMYLCEALIDEAGDRHPMAGVLPGASRMERLTIGYREVVAIGDSPLAEAGWTVRGHEFHHSVRIDGSPSPAYRRKDGEETEGEIGGPAANVLASYVHVHFGADPRLAMRLVASAAAARDACGEGWPGGNFPTGGESMKRILLAALVLAAAPSMLRAQHVPVPLPADTSRLLPALHPNLVPQATSRTEAVLNGALQGAATGAVYALLLTQTEPRCAPSSSARGSGVAGAAVGAVWGGVRGLLGIRPKPGPIRTDVPAGTSSLPSLPPVGDSLCRGTLRAVGVENP